MLVHYKRSQRGGFPVFAGSAFQRGRGFGSVMSKMFKNFIVPMAKDAGKALLKTGMRKATNVMNEVASGKSVKSAIKDEFIPARLNPGKRKAQTKGRGQRPKKRRRTAQGDIWSNK